MCVRAEAFERAGLPVRWEQPNGTTDPAMRIGYVSLWLYHIAGWCVPAYSHAALCIVVEHQHAFEAAWRLGGDMAVDALWRSAVLLRLGGHGSVARLKQELSRG